MAYTGASKQPVKIDVNRISQLTYDLNANLNEQKPDNWFFKWFSRQKIQSDNLRTNALHQYIESVRLANFQKSYLEKQEQLSPQIIEEILLGDLQRARLLREKELAEHHDHLIKIKDEQASRRLQLEEKIAQIDSIIALNRLTGGQADLLEKIVRELDINNITPAQAFILVKALNPIADASADFSVQQLMIEAKLDEMRADTDKKREEVRSLKAKADLESANTKATIKEIGDG